MALFVPNKAVAFDFTVESSRGKANAFGGALSPVGKAMIQN